MDSGGTLQGLHMTVGTTAATAAEIQLQNVAQIAGGDGQLHVPNVLLLTSSSGGSLPSVVVPTPLPSMTFEDANKSWDMLQFHRKARDNEKYCDAVLHVHGQQFLCHRIILAANSPYFDSIFQSRIANAAVLGIKQRNSQYYSKNSANVSRAVMMESLIVGCTEPEVFQIFLNFMYTGNVTIDKSNVAELLRLSNNFMVGKLKEYCAEYLERFIDAENCIQVKEVGEKYNIPSLVKCSTQFVHTHLGEVINHEIMMDLLPKQVESFVMDKGFQISHEIAVKFMSKWVCHDIPLRERDYKHMLTNIDWNTMDHDTVIAYVDQEPLYGSSERCFYYVLQSLGEKGIRVDKYDEIYQALQQRFGQEPDQPLGYGDNLLQMAFNSAMEGLQVPSESSWTEGKGKKASDENEARRATKPKNLTLEQRRKRVLKRVHRNRAVKRWVVMRLDRPKNKNLAGNEMVADSSGDEECDPTQAQEGYHCHMCPYTAKKISRLERHLACIHAHDVTYRCSECGFTCKWNREYFLHMKSHFDGPPYKCLNCEFTASKIGALISHRISHLDLKPYHCNECDFKSRSKANLAVHVKIHNNEKPYRCNICGRNFASKNSLDQHAVGHNTDKTYSCTQCPFSTKYLNHFTNHKKTHHVQSGKKQKELYRCSDSQCKYTTSKKSQLESHMRSHAGVRPHVCSICGRRFLEKSHLVRHERIHFNERPFKCEECDYASTRRDKLKEHKNRHHGANASAKSPYKPRPHKAKNNGAQVQVSPGTPTSSQPPLVYAKKSPARKQQNTPSKGTSHSQAHTNQTQQTVATNQQHETNGTVISGADGELEFIIPHGSTMSGITTSDGGTSQQTFAAQISQAAGIDLQQIANSGGIVQLRPYQPVASASSVSLSSSISNSTAVSNSQTLSIPHSAVDVSASSVLNSGTTLMAIQPSQQASMSGDQQTQFKLIQRKPGTVDLGGRKLTKSRLILVQQAKPTDTIQVAQTLASFQGGLSTQDLQRTLIKLDDFQAHNLLSGTTSIKLEDLAGVQSGQSLTVTQAMPGGTRGTTTMVLDAAQFQQLQRGIPIAITSSVPISSSSTQIQAAVSQSSSAQSATVIQGDSTNQRQSNNQHGNPTDFAAGIGNLFC